VGVSLEALSTKPVALAPVETTIKIGVHIYLLPTHKKRGVSAPTLGEQIPPKKAKRQGLPRLLALALSVWAISVRLLLAV